MDKETNREKYFIIASDMVSVWLKNYRQYLADGDPNGLHPKARTALVLSITDALLGAQDAAKVRKKTGE